MRTREQDLRAHYGAALVFRRVLRVVRLIDRRRVVLHGRRFHTVRAPSLSLSGIHSRESEKKDGKYCAMGSHPGERQACGVPKRDWSLSGP
jgi:hypothetical protein